MIRDLKTSMELEILPGDDRSAVAAPSKETAGCTVIVTPGRCSDMAGSPIASLKVER
jgi:hypothetical protein